jgi:hypothetical protein
MEEVLESIKTYEGTKASFLDTMTAQLNQIRSLAHTAYSFVIIHPLLVRKSPLLILQIVQMPQAADVSAVVPLECSS